MLPAGIPGVDNQFRASANFVSKSLKPFLYVLACFGGYETNSQDHCCGYLYTVYTAVIFSGVVALPLRVAMLMNWNQSVTTVEGCLKKMQLAWAVQSLFAGISAIWVIRRGKLRRFIRQWDEIGLDESVKETGLEKDLNRKIFLVQTLGFVSLLTQWVSAVIVGLFATVPLYRTNMFILPQLQHLVTVCYMVNQVFWVMHQMVFVCIILCTATAWRSLSEGLAPRKCHDQFSQLIERTMKKQDQLCDLVQEISQAFGFYAFTQLVMAVPAIVLLLYAFTLSLFDPGQDAVLKIQVFFFILCESVQIGVICYAATVGSAATELANRFYKIFVRYTIGECDSIDLKQMDACDSKAEQKQGNIQKASALLIRLQGEVSVTVFSLGPITKAFSLTMISVIFNYFFFLIQFAQQEPCGQGQWLNSTRQQLRRNGNVLESLQSAWAGDE